jgi:hypothetical protein
VTEAAIVAFYGEGKPVALRHFVADLQGSLADGLGDAFVPRSLGTVHTTLIGLDSVAPDARGDLRTLVEDAGTDLVGLAADLVGLRPPTIQYGGFEPGRPGLRSRGLSLHERSLVRGGSDVVLVGWPVESGEPCLALHDARMAAKDFGFEHRYPLTDEEPDPDSHLVIGTLAGHADAGSVDAVVADLRDRMARQDACRVEMRAEDLAVVLYSENDLPPGTTTVVPLTDLVATARPGVAPTAP